MGRDRWDPSRGLRWAQPEPRPAQSTRSAPPGLSSRPDTLMGPSPGLRLLPDTAWGPPLLGGPPPPTPSPKHRGSRPWELTLPGHCSLLVPLPPRGLSSGWQRTPSVPTVGESGSPKPRGRRSHTQKMQGALSGGGALKQPPTPPHQDWPEPSRRGYFREGYAPQPHTHTPGSRAPGPCWVGPDMRQFLPGCLAGQRGHVHPDPLGGGRVTREAAPAPTQLYRSWSLIPASPEPPVSTFRPLGDPV